MIQPYAILHPLSDCDLVHIMSASVLMKDITVQTEFPLTMDAATSTGFLWWDQDADSSPVLDLQLSYQRQLRARSELTLTDLHTQFSTTFLRERLRLLQEEAVLEGQVQAARMAALRAKKDLLLGRMDRCRSSATSSHSSRE